MRKTAWLLCAIVVCPLGLEGLGGLHSAPEAPQQPHRSPLDLAVLPGGTRVLTANHTSESASLVDLEGGKVLAEVPCRGRPAGVACSRDGRRAAVSGLWSGTLTLLEVGEESLRAVGTVAVGYQPRSLVFAPDGGSLYVALAGAHEVVQVAWPTGRVLQRWPAPTEPRRLVLSPDGRFLAAACGRSGEVRCWDTRSGKQAWARRVFDAFNLHGLAFTPDGKDLVTAYVHHRQNPFTRHHINEGWAVNSRLARLPVEMKPGTENSHTDYTQIGLDTRGQAVGDPCAVALSAMGGWLAVAAAGTHELMIFQWPAVVWMPGDAGDFLDSSLEIDPRKLRRLPLGGRPVAVQMAGAGDRAVVANYLLDAVQVVDLRAGKVVSQIDLGAPSRPALARQGEAIFYDSRRSHHQWLSCHTCHPDGHTAGRAFDTLNDDTYGNPKMAPTLRGVTRTAPWTWHGWQKDLGQSVEKSLTETMFGPKPSAEDVKAVLAFLGTLDHPPAAYRDGDGALTDPAQRGRALFFGKARCSRCHQGEEYTSATNRDVKLESDDSPFDLWNPPSLRGVRDRGPYLHDGRAETLEELLRRPHAPEKLGGEALTPEERQDLIEYLRSL